MMRKTRKKMCTMRKTLCRIRKKCVQMGRNAMKSGKKDRQFRERYKLTPSEFRKVAKDTPRFSATPNI